MLLKDIKIIAKNYIYFSENPKDSIDKLKLMEFVDKANEQQINYLLLEGIPLEEENILLKEVSDLNMKITSFVVGKTPEQIRNIVAQAEFAQNPDLILQLYKTGLIRSGTVAGGVIASAAAIALLIWLAGKFYKVKLSKAAKACKQYSGDKKKQCTKKFNTDALNSKVLLLQKTKSVCNKAKKPEKCKAKIQQQIDKVNKKFKE
jgi:hypothetical protein